ncbi:zinc finger protein 260-like [Mytilus trossulus]|uniref:zinc finger protein 260-like n=1 Tax=Mytilus trossulus TaxID=6551 RepID=UPI003007E842
MNQEILIDGVPVQIPAGNYKTEYLPDGTVQIVVYSNTTVDTGAEGEFKWKGHYCRTIGIQNTTVPHHNSYDFADSGVQTDFPVEEDEETTVTEDTNLEVEDEQVEEMIRDEENQENFGRGKRKRGRPPTTFKPVKPRKSFSNASVIQNIQDDESEKSDKTVHKCGLCGITYKRRANWQNHLKTHAKEKIYMCGYCGNLFQKANFLQHLKTHKDEQDEANLRPIIETNPRRPDRPSPPPPPPPRTPTQQTQQPTHTAQPPQQTIQETESSDGEKQFMVKSHQVTLPNQQVATLIDLGNLMDVSVNEDGTIDGVETPKTITADPLDESGIMNNDLDYNPSDGIDDTKYIYKCNVCGKEYNSKSNCHRHLKTHTHAKVYKCNDCDKTYMHRYELKMHRRIHTGEKPYKCPICTRAFNESGNLRRHMKIHAGDDTPYKCGVCFKGFSDMYRLHVHLKVHSGKIVCDTCGKSFTKISDLYRHIRIHTGDKPYKCDVCKKAFAQKVNLQTHYRTHTGKTPYRCDICNFGFSRKQILDNHMRGHEEEELEELKKQQEEEKESSNIEEEDQIHVQNVMDAAADNEEGLIEVPEDAQEVETGLSQEELAQLVAASVVEHVEVEPTT